MSRPASSKKCERCGERWAQPTSMPYCRRCAREAGITVLPGVERERQHVVMMEARELARLRDAGRARYQPAQTYTVVAEGHEFEVINDRLGFGRAFTITDLPPYPRRSGAL